MELLGEFDALTRSISDNKFIIKMSLLEGGAGHGCGHNLFGTASLGAAVAIKELIEKGSLKGTMSNILELQQKKNFLVNFG